jgi:hypothetical protein
LPANAGGDAATHQLYNSNEHRALSQRKHMAATSERYSHFDLQQRQPTCNVAKLQQL